MPVGAPVTTYSPAASGPVAGGAGLASAPKRGAAPASGSTIVIAVSGSAERFRTTVSNATVKLPSAASVGPAVTRLAMPTAACGTTRKS